MFYPGYHWWRARRHAADCGTWAGSWGYGPSFSRAWEERRASGERFATIRDEMHEAMETGVGIFRKADQPIWAAFVPCRPKQ